MIDDRARVDSQIRQQIQNNRHYLNTLAEILLLCGKQDIPLRGRHEIDPSLNRGIFLEILQAVALHDQIVKEKLEKSQRNTTYTYFTRCTELNVKILGDMIRKSICDRVN